MFYRSITPAGLLLLPILAGPLACGPSGEDVTPTPEATPAPDTSASPTHSAGEVTPTPSPYVYEPEAPPPPDLSPEVLAAAITSSLQLAMSLDLFPAMERYDEVYTTKDGSCPFRLDDRGPGYTATYWADQCTATSGTDFMGEGYRLTQDTVDASGIRWTFEGLYLAGRTTAADGREVQAASVGYNGVGTDATGSYYYLELDGAFAVSPDTGSSWLSGEVRPSLALIGYYSPRLALSYLAVDGGLAGVEGELGTVLFSGMEISTVSACPQEAGGSISVRSTNGEWYDVLFNGPTADVAEPDPSLCDSCGQVWYRGAYIYDTCVDFSPLTSWTEAPW